MGKKAISVLVPAALAIFLILIAGCGAYNPSGSGSGSGGGGSSPGAAQGFYSCSLASGTAMQALILSDDTFWGIFGTLASNSFSVSGMATGKGASTTTGYSGTFTEFLSTGGSTTTVVSATDVPGSSISGTVTIGGAQTGFGGTALSSSFYTFATPASISSIAGTWAGTLLDGNNSSVTLNISSTGSITTPTTSTGCQVSGTVTADTTDNFFTTNLRFGGTPCVASLANQNATGVALVYVLQDGTTTQLLMPATVGTTLGTIFFAAH